MTAFIIEETRVFRGKSYVLARQDTPGAFVAGQDARIGGILVAPRLEAHRAFSKERKQSGGLFVFCLVGADLQSLKAGDKVDYTFSSGRLQCLYCGASMVEPCKLSKERIQEAERLQRHGNKMKAISTLSLAGVSLSDAKVIVNHFSAASSACHRCGGGVAFAGAATTCQACYSLNVGTNAE